MAGEVASPIALVAVGAALASGYYARLAFRANVSARRIALCSKLYARLNDLGLATGALVSRPNVEKITDQQVHEDPEFRRVMEAYFSLVRELDLFRIVMPSSLLRYEPGLRTAAANVYFTFLNGQFGELTDLFNRLDGEMTPLRGHIRRALRLPD